jgi:hypothetical protein
VSRLRLNEAALAGIGIAFILAALAASQSWWDRHFMPIFAIARPTLVAAEMTVRGLACLTGIALVLVLRRPIAAVMSRATSGDALRVFLAVVLALACAELYLRGHPPYPHDADPLQLEPRRRIDPLLGWEFLPGRSVVTEEAGRPVSYSFDDAGYRVSAPGAAVDVAQPTLLFSGESIIAGYGLAWENTIPARVGALLGIQSANLAVSDYSNDQSFLRLAAELPRFREPLAVVTLFMPALFDRNLLGNRPQLTAGVISQPAVSSWRLAALLRWLIPYRSTATVEQGITRTRDSLRALVDLARARHAEPLIVVPQFGAQSAIDQMLRRRILDEAGLPYVEVTLDPSWHLPGDMHPDSRGARAIAIALAGRLRRGYSPAVQWQINAESRSSQLSGGLCACQ